VLLLDIGSSESAASQGQSGVITDSSHEPGAAMEGDDHDVDHDCGSGR
jgi:hypothetical protein